MSYYDKKIVYLSWMEYGSKIKSAGFIKAEIRGNTIILDMHVSGVKEAEEKKYDICIVLDSGKEEQAGTIFIHNGMGDWKKIYEQGKINGKSLTWENIGGFVIRVSDTKTIEGKTGLKKVQNGSTEEVKDRERTAVPFQKEAAGKFSGMELKAGSIEIVEEVENGAEGSTGNKVGEWCGYDSQNKGEKASEREIKLDEVILNDKWQQLCRIYPVIHPYEDEREYISIQPKDFVIMTGDYQHMANNSFLLHGFYNYRHIILGKEKESTAYTPNTAPAEKQKEMTGEKVSEHFYLGVPGVYYEREKMVALMFGFEAFECSGGKADTGKFGYYLRKVKI